MLHLATLSKRYPNGNLALHNIELTIQQGEIFGILGGSGCGKSTLLRLIAGLDRATGGSIVLDGEEVTAPRPEIGVVFQEPRLMPWLSIADNVAFGIRHLPKAEQKTRVDETLERVGLARFAKAWPRELSGGQAQRVALARALVGRPRVLLLDEPFSALDALTRFDLQEHLLQLWAYDRPTMILVTHDIEEALALADRIAVMQPGPGHIQSVVTPPLSRPRARQSRDFHEWRIHLLGELHESFAAVNPSHVVPTRPSFF